MCNKGKKNQLSCNIWMFNESTNTIEHELLNDCSNQNFCNLITIYKFNLIITISCKGQIIEDNNKREKF